MSPQVFSGHLLHLQTPCLNRHSGTGFISISVNSVSEPEGSFRDFMIL